MLRSENGVTEVVGTVMIFGIFVISAAIIYTVGVPVIQSQQSLSYVRSIEQSFTALDSKFSKSALGEAPSQVIKMNLGGGNIYVKSDNWMNLTIEAENGSITDCINISLGALVYDKNERSIAYEGGGVWTKDLFGWYEMLSPPEFHYDGTTLTLPIIRFDETTSSAGGNIVNLAVSTNNTPTIHFPSATVSGTCGTATRANPLTAGNVFLTIKSDYCESWRDYMEEQTDIEVDADNCDQNNTVTLKLVAPYATTPFSQAIFASNTLILWNNFDVRSYNSTTTKCSGSASGSGNITAVHSILLENNADVDGSANSSGSITLNNNAGVSGTCRGNPVTLGSGASCGTVVQQSASIESMQSVDDTIADKISSFNSSNDNAGVSCITNNEIDMPGGNTSTISADGFSTFRKIYLTKFHMSNNDKIIFDASDAGVDIAIASGSQFLLDNGANISVFGNYPVRFFLGSNVNFEWGTGVCLLINPTLSGSWGSKARCNREAPAGALSNSSILQFWMYSTGNQVLLENNNDFFGVIYAPGRDFRLDNNVYICGAVIGNAVDVKNNVQFQYDENLQNAQLFSGEAIIQYLHVSENALDVNIW
jgi:hypothetical protein